MVLFCEVNKTGLEHATVNKQMLRLLGRAFPSETIHARVSETHWEAISESVKGYDVVPFFERVVSPEKGNKWRWIVKLLSECKRDFLMLRYAQRQQATLVFFASSSPVGNLFVSLLSKFLFKRCKVVVTLHGELQLLRMREGKYVDKVYVTCLRKAFSMKLPGRRYLLLDKYIRDRLLDYRLMPAENMMAIRHPLTYGGDMHHPHQLRHGIVFGHLGVAKLEKRSPMFFELAARFQAAVSEGMASFVVAGQLLDDMRPFTNSWVEYSHDDKLLSHADYLVRCAGMHYAVFFYDDEGYELISSGTIMDAISLEIPIIAFRNRYFTHFFEQCEIPPGILCENTDEFYKVVDKIITTDEYDYARMKLGMQLLKQKFDLGQIQADFSSQLVGFLN